MKVWLLFICAFLGLVGIESANGYLIFASVLGMGGLFISVAVEDIREASRRGL